MAYLKPASQCDCKTCKGHEAAPEGVFGGWICTCMCHRHSHQSGNAARTFNTLDAMCKAGKEVEAMSDDNLLESLAKLDEYNIDSRESCIFGEVIDRFRKYKEQAARTTPPDEPTEAA